ncbi:MAG: DUF6113 family protein [Candidatus Nanopelagicales bacterium]|jgi:hypothetical protein|nr:DUF6113 family protein [Candidatus Nanopelagicales bacterium]MCF8538018.1 DUF6113 family protein [Candidatus Nanopelagicales bacterium]MCF8542806.1 DUF6113 family protein [Candidatus Nanopelagicales bacterium]MCF8556463.1 DUF6113 family protein [Candidatus Nanopelagicales bacterium]
MTSADASGGTRWLLVAVLLGAGLVIGVAGAFVQAHRGVLDLPWAVVVVPWGFLLVWVTLLAAIRGGAWWIHSRWGGSAVAVGWLLATVLMSAESPSGDLALSGGGRQMTYLLGGVILASAAASLPVPRRNLPVS